LYLRSEKMRSEPNLTFPRNITVQVAQAANSSPSELKQRFWIGVIAFCGFSGVASGVTALLISLLTFGGLLREGRGMGLVVSALLVGSLGALLMAAHGMDRIAAVRRSEEN